MKGLSGLHPLSNLVPGRWVDKKHMSWVSRDRSWHRVALSVVAGGPSVLCVTVCGRHAEGGILRALENRHVALEDQKPPQVGVSEHSSSITVKHFG